jgi:hypothetical protein
MRRYILLYIKFKTFAENTIIYWRLKLPGHWVKMSSHYTFAVRTKLYLIWVSIGICCAGYHNEDVSITKVTTFSGLRCKARSF